MRMHGYFWLAAISALTLAGCGESPSPTAAESWPGEADWQLPPEKHPLLKDRTGLIWTVPFRQARAEAEAKHRLLLIKPSDFGSFRDGDW